MLWFDYLRLVCMRSLLYARFCIQSSTKQSNLKCKRKKVPGKLDGIDVYAFSRRRSMD